MVEQKLSSALVSTRSERSGAQLERFRDSGPAKKPQYLHNDFFFSCVSKYVGGLSSRLVCVSVDPVVWRVRMRDSARGYWFLVKEQ